MKKLLILFLLPLTLLGQKEVVIHIKTDNYPSKQDGYCMTLLTEEIH